jgi:hypothetical protein
VANADRFSVARFQEALGATVEAALAGDGASARPRLVHDAAA